MSRILFAWQLGANYGHLTADLPIAEQLRRQGHTVSFAAADAGVAAELLSPRGFSYVAAPRRTHSTPSLQTPACYAEIMLASGFADDATLEGLVREWCDTLRSARADVVVADHAPAALVAARILAIPAVIVGTGFTVPPQIAPLPSIRPWDAIDAARLRRAEDLALGNINALLSRAGRSSLGHLCELFACPDVLLTTFPELDPYGVRANAAYIGPVRAESDSQPVRWRAVSPRRVFAYLRPTVPRLGATLLALEECGAEVICVMPGAGRELAQHFESTSLTLLGHPIPLAPILSGCDAVVGYGGAGVIAASLIAGVPMLLVPQTAEQYLGSLQVAKLNAGIVIGPRQTDAEVAPALERLLTGVGYREAARCFAVKYRAHGNATAARTAAAIIADRASRAGASA